MAEEQGLNADLIQGRENPRQLQITQRLGDRVSPGPVGQRGPHTLGPPGDGASFANGICKERLHPVPPRRLEQAGLFFLRGVLRPAHRFTSKDSGE